MSPQRFKSISEVHLILQRDGMILTLRRFNTGYEDGRYSLIAGHVDANETLKQAMQREAKEEAGIDIQEDQMQLCHVMHRLSDQERLSFFFIADAWQGEPTNTEPDKCDDFRWIAPDAMEEETIPYIRAGVAASLEGRIYSDFGWPSSSPFNP